MITSRNSAVKNSAVRVHNRAMLLELIRTRGPLSRTDLARLSSLSMATAVGIVDELEQEALVADVGEGLSTGGRRPTLVGLVPDSRLVIGLEIGTDTLTAVIVNLTAEIKHRIHVPSLMSEGPSAIQGQIKQLLVSLDNNLRQNSQRYLGIGVAFPAPVRGDDKDKASSPPSYPGWGDLNISQTIAEFSSLPVLVDNDANARAVGEHLFGAGSGHDEIFYIVCHRGLGGAVTMDGALRQGANGNAGEIGHTVIDLNGPVCGCGQKGCLEAFVGYSGIVRQFQSELRRCGRDEMIGRSSERLQAVDVVNAALSGDSAAMTTLQAVGKYLGIGIANIVKAFDPAVIILGGPTLKAERLLLDAIKDELQIRLLRNTDLPLIAVGQLEEDAGAIGAAALVLRRLFAVPVHA